MNGRWQQLPGERRGAQPRARSGGAASDAGAAGGRARAPQIRWARRAGRSRKHARRRRHQRRLRARSFAHPALDVAYLAVRLASGYWVARIDEQRAASRLSVGQASAARGPIRQKRTFGTRCPARCAPSRVQKTGRIFVYAV